MQFGWIISHIIQIPSFDYYTVTCVSIRFCVIYLRIVDTVYSVIKYQWFLYKWIVGRGVGDLMLIMCYAVFDILQVSLKERYLIYLTGCGIKLAECLQIKTYYSIGTCQYILRMGKEAMVKW